MSHLPQLKLPISRSQNFDLLGRTSLLGEPGILAAYQKYLLHHSNHEDAAVIEGEWARGRGGADADAVLQRGAANLLQHRGTEGSGGAAAAVAAG